MREIAKKYIKEVLSISDMMADNPEIGNQEYKSSAALVEMLRSVGVEVEYPYDGMETAFCGTINKGKGPVIAILAEYDALRGMGHACGHCASGSISLLAALILNEIKDGLDAEVRIIGTPDEEMLGGKAYMVKHGVFDDVDTAIMIHMYDKNMIFSPILALAAFEIEFHGAPAHAAAAPWEGRNALNAIRLMFDGMDMMRQHVKSDARLHGYIQEGGVASNIVPDFTKGEFTFRSSNNSDLEDMIEWAYDIAKGAALITRTTVNVVEIGERFYELTEKKTGNSILREIYESEGLKTDGDNMEPGGSSDIGNVDYVCPAFHPLLSIGAPYMPHTVEFAQAMKTDAVHRAIEDGGVVIARFVKSLADNHELLESIKAEHAKLRGRI